LLLSQLSIRGRSAAAIDHAADSGRWGVGRSIIGHWGRTIAAATLLSSGLVGPPALAQDIGQEADRTDVRRASVDDTIRASNAAISAMNDPSCPDVSFADILANPDDTALNVCYARAQIQQGNVRGAAATLERVLLIAPDAINVRLLYAIVLFRLDTIDEAEREFLEVGQADLPPEVRAQIDDFLAEIERRRQKVKQTVTVGIGTYLATNRNSAPDSERQLALGVGAPIALEENRPNIDHGLLTILGYDFTYDPGLSNQHEIFGGVDLFADSLAEQSELDIHSLNMDVGVRLRFPGFTVTPRAYLTNMRLEWAKFYQAEGFELRVDHKHKIVGVDWPLLDTYASFSAQDEDYHNTPSFQTLTLRNGPKYNTKIGLGMLVHPEHYVAWRGGAEFKSSAPDSANNADARVFSYKYYDMELSHTWLLGDGRFLLSSLMMGWRDYKAADSLIVGGTGQQRYEQPNRARMTYGMPLTDVLGDDWMPSGVNVNDTLQDFFNGSTLALSAEMFYQRSNITNFQYSSRRVQALLTRKLDF
jgi:hypothetical protein